MCVCVCNYIHIHIHIHIHVCVFFLHMHIIHAQSKVETGVQRNDRYTYICVCIFFLHVIHAQSKVETGVQRNDRITYEKTPASAETVAAVQHRVIAAKAEQDAAAARRAKLLQAQILFFFLLRVELALLEAQILKRQLVVAIDRSPNYGRITIVILVSAIGGPLVLLVAAALGQDMSQ